jgi:hypothetical protein
MVYYEPLAIFGGTTPYLLLEDPLDIDDDNDPGQQLDFSLYASADAAEVLALERLFIDPHSDVWRVMNHAVCRCTVECGANARITRVEMTLGRYNMTTGVFTPIGTAVQPANFANLNGAASRVIRGIVDDTVVTTLAAAERLAFRVRVYGFRTAGGVPVPIILWHNRGLDDCMVEVDVVYAEAV